MSSTTAYMYECPLLVLWLVSHFRHGALYKVLGEIEMRQGLFSSARALFSQGLDQDPHYAPVYHAAALLEAKLGNIEVPMQ